MKLITTAMRVSDVADRWEKQYFRDGVWRPTGPVGAPLSSERTQRIVMELRALPKGAGGAEVATIIGNVDATAVRRVRERGRRLRRGGPFGAVPRVLGQGRVARG